MYMYVHMFTSSSRTDIPIFTKLGMLIPWDHKENIGGSNLREKCLEFESRWGRKLSKMEERRQDQSCLLWKGHYRNKSHNAEKLAWVRVPMKMVSVARKLSTIEERNQNQSCLFRRRDYKNKDRSPENVPEVRVPVKIVAASRKLITVEERRQEPKVFASLRGFQKQRPQPRKTVLGSSPGLYAFM
jgi:hypothetical protein